MGFIADVRRLREINKLEKFLLKEDDSFRKGQREAENKGLALQMKLDPPDPSKPKKLNPETEKDISNLHKFGFYDNFFARDKQTERGEKIDRYNKLTASQDNKKAGFFARLFSGRSGKTEPENGHKELGLGYANRIDGYSRSNPGVATLETIQKLESSIGGLDGADLRGFKEVAQEKKAKGAFWKQPENRNLSEKDMNAAFEREQGADRAANERAERERSQREAEAQRREQL